MAFEKPPPSVPGVPPLSTVHLVRCLDDLEAALAGLEDHRPDEVAYRIYRAAAIKQFELILEIAGKLLRRRVRDWLASDVAAHRLTFKDVFRTAAQFTLLDVDACERWLEYRDRRNQTAHDYGEAYPEAMLPLLPAFHDDARALVRVLTLPRA